jgi:hypothetical protein
MASRPLAVYFGHHKSASSWIEMIAKEVCRELRLRVAVVYDADKLDTDLGTFVRARRADFLAYSNANGAFVKQLPDFRGFHVVRDPRDMCVSAYFSHRNSHPTERWPELAEHRKRLQEVPQDEGLFLEMEFSRRYFEDMRDWDADDPRILELKMEDVTADPYAHALRIFTFLGLADDEEFTAGKRAAYFFAKIARRVEHWGGYRFTLPVGPRLLPAERLLGIVWERDFRRLSGGRKQGDEDEKSHYRRGTPGDWRNHFKPEHVTRFKEQYNDVLLKYTYESDPDWDATEKREPAGRA